jgi:tetratricopeptide (TPR) repeat protein
MTRIQAKSIIRGLRRNVLIATLISLFLMGILSFSLVGVAILSSSSFRTQSLWSAATFAGLAWVMLTVLSARQVRSANQAAAYLSAGRFDLAEQELTAALQTFSLYRTGKLLVCHNLAVVVHGQKNYIAAAELCDGIISLQRRSNPGVGRVCRILLADCRLFLGDTLAAFKALQPLIRRRSELSLGEQLLLLPIELRCTVADGRYEDAVRDLPGTIRRAELLDSPRAALVHALLAKACKALGREAQGRRLEERAELYHDLSELQKEYAVLGDSPAANNP